MIKWLKRLKENYRNRHIYRVMDNLHKLDLKDLKEMADYAEALYSAEKYRQERMAAKTV